MEVREEEAVVVAPDEGCVAAVRGVASSPLLPSADGEELTVLLDGRHFTAPLSARVCLHEMQQDICMHVRVGWCDR